MDNDCCQVAVAPAVTTAAATAASEPAAAAQTMAVDPATATMSTATLKRSKGKQAPAAAAVAAAAAGGTAAAAQQPQQSAAGTASNFNTLERNMAEVAERNRRSEAQLAAGATLDRTGTLGRGGGTSCDTCDAPLTPASLAGIDHRDLEHRPLTRSVTRATMFDEPPEK